MPNLLGTTVQYTANMELISQDGYVNIGVDGYTQISTLPVVSLIKAFARTGAGVWTCTLVDTWPAAVKTLTNPLVRFRVDVVYTTDPGANVLMPVILSDNINTNGTQGSGVINFEFLNSSGTKTDLPADGGFRFSIAVVNSNLYL
jgi:hypothetical protein